MDRQKILKISYRIVSVLLFITVLFCSIFSSCEGVFAADPDINSLPVDIDIDVEYTSDSISLKYLNNTYSINRNTSIDLLGTGYYDSLVYSGGSALNGYYKEYYPISFEYTDKGLTNCSYWFSPSELKVYVLTSDYFVRSSSYFGSLNSVCSFSSGSDYGFFSFFNSYVQTSGFCFISVIDLSSNFLSLGRLYASKNKAFSSYTCLDDPDSTSTLYFPNDLVCIFSNYAISGFYDPDTSKVNTPDYYFDFQYIFYSEGNGYTFVDSASRLSSIGFPSGVNTARYTFEDTGNFYVYTSVDGITWVKKTSVTTMYSDYFDVKYDSNFATTYLLVYTNDSYYGEDAVVPPEYGDITDITSDLDSFLDEYDIVSSGRGQGSYKTDFIVLETSSSDDIVPSFLSSMSYSSVIYATYHMDVGSDDGLATMYEDVHVYFFGFSEPPDTIYLNTFVDSSSADTGIKVVDWFIEYMSNAQNTYHLVSSTKVPTFAMYLRLLNNSISNLDFSLNALRVDLHSDLESVFDNISNSNIYLSRLLDEFRSFSIPDFYSESLHNLEYNLTHVNDSLQVEIAELISGLPDYSGTLNDISSVVEGIPSQLNSLFVADKLIDAIDPDSLFDSDLFDLSGVKSFVSAGISVTAVNSFSKLLDFDAHTLSGFKFINGYVTKLYNVNHTFSMVCLIGVGFTTMNYVIRKSKG